MLSEQPFQHSYHRIHVVAGYMHGQRLVWEQRTVSMAEVAARQCRAADKERANIDWLEHPALLAVHEKIQVELVLVDRLIKAIESPYQCGVIE